MQLLQTAKPNHSMSTTLLTTILCAAYMFFGALGSTLAISPSYATPAFPAAGLALAASLYFGKRALPGVFLGAALLNLIIISQHGTFSGTAILAALLIALGATLQAWIGQSLIGQVLGNTWRSFEQEKNITIFLVLGGLTATLISPTFGIIALRACSLLDSTDPLFSWWTWYLGDTLGTLTVAPLALLLLERNPLQRERGRRLAAPIGLLFLLVALK